MDKNFQKFKRKVWIEILIKCLSCGLAAAFLAVDAVLLPCKLLGINLLWLYYVLIGLGGFAVGAAIGFLLFRTNDRKIAMRLDKELNLDERVQTTYVYGSQNSDMLDLQRADTVKTLGGVSAASLRFANLAALILSAVIAVSAIAGAIVIGGVVPPVFAPKTEQSGPPEEPPREVTGWEWAALDDLIEYVKNSKKADVAVKTGMSSELIGLRSVLLNGVSQSGLSAFVQNTVNNIRNLVKAANERSDITDEQKGLNSSEENYVINKLYEIFNLSRGNDDTPGGEQPGTTPNPGGDGEEDGNKGNTEWEWGGNDVPFFDPETGYTTASNSEIRDKYYEMVQKAFEEGTLSRDEWEYIMATYFADLSKDEK